MIEILQLDPFYNGGENIEIAKGKYKLHDTFKGKLKQEIRNIRSHGRKKGN